ncbi:MAG: hypothetical protein Q8L84_04175 [Hyphomonas sp.]|nr:hypothetical protein [Hyphomonas sp.]
MKYLLTGKIALTLLTGCGQKDKLAGGGVPASVVFNADDLPDVSVRKGDSATAGAALSVLSLAESGSGRLSFADSDIKGDKAVFTNVTLSAPELASEGTPASPSDSELAEIFAFMDTDSDGVADDGSGMTFDDLRADMQVPASAPSPAPVVKAAKLEFDGLGMFEGRANFGLMKLSDVTITPAEGSEDQSTGKIASIELVNPSPETAAWVASLLGKGEPAPFPEGTALSFDRWMVNGVNFNVSDASGTGLFTVDSMHISDLKEEKAGLMGLSNLKFDFAESAGSDVKISLAGFGVKGINYGLFSEALSAGAGASTNPAGLTSAIQADPANPGYDALSLKALKADIVGASVDLASLTSSVSRDKQGRATKIVTDPFSLTVAARDNPDGEQFAGALATMGYETLTFSGAGESQYDPDADIVTLAKGKNYWRLNDGFKLDFSAKYAGTKALAAAQVASLEENADPEAMLTSVMENVVIHQLEFALDDDGIVDRALNAYAAQSGEDPAAVRSQISGMFAMAPMFAASTGIDTVVVTELATALSSFVTAPKTLTISLAPKTPIKAQAFVDAASDPSKKLTKDSLGFSASNK